MDRTIQRLADFARPAAPPARRLTAEARLMVAVMESAANDLRLCARTKSKSGQLLYAEAWQWFQVPGYTWPFCLERVCEVLGWEAAWVRQQIREQYPSPTA